MKKSLLCLFLAAAMLFSASSMMIACAAETVSEDGAESSAETESTSSVNTDSRALTDYVDMRYGTESDGMSIGPTRPNASVLPAPDTYPRSYSTGYLPTSPIRGFSQTHMSAGAEKYGNVLVSPQIGLATATASHDSEKANENPNAAEYSVTLSKYDIDVAFTPTEHAVIYKFTYPASDNASLVLDVAYNICRNTYKVDDLNVAVEEDENGNTIIYGYGEFDAGTIFAPYYQYFYAVIDKEATETGTFIGSETSSETKALGPISFTTSDSEYAQGTGAYMTFATEADEEIYMKIGVSFTSVDKAKQWLDSEIPAWDYDKVKNDTLDIWNKKLSVIEIGGESLTEEQKTLFYTSLYKSFINPRDRTGDIAKFGDYDMVDDHLCIWDTFRTLYPLYSIIDNEFYAKTVNSTIARLEINGCVRDHYHAGYERMLQQGGDDIDNVIAEAYLKGISGDIDWEAAYEVVKNNAENWRDDQTATMTAVPGKISTYITNGYIPADGDLARMCCSKTVEYAYNDYLAAQMANGLAESAEENGETEKAASYTADYEKYIARSNNWMNLWNPDIESDGYKGYIWPKTADGEWIEPNADLPSASTFIGSWKPYFYEGTCYSYSFFVPHDIDTLIEKMGGETTFIDRLQTGIDNGWINVGNQPGFLQAFMFNHTSEPWHTSDYVSKMLKGFSVAGGTPGYDDSGSLCAWYIFANVGFFPNAGQDFYYLTSPKYETATFNLENGNTFTVKANNLSETNKYIQSVSLNGKLLSATTINHTDIMNGGTLVYEMGSTPVDYSSVEIASGSVATDNYEWTLNSKGLLTISGTGDGTLRFDTEITAENISDIPWYSVREDILKVVIAEETGITNAAAYALSNLPNCQSITLPTTLTDLSGNRIFAADTSLTTLKMQGNTTSGEFDLLDATALGDNIFEGSSEGLTVKLRVGKCEFAPVNWFTDSTTVNFIAYGRSSADEWINGVKSGTADTRSDGYKFTIGTVDLVIGGDNTVSSNEYSWTLDTETGILTFVNTKTSGYNELAFSKTSSAFNEWVADWKDEIEHIVIPSFGKLSIASDVVSPFAGLTNLKTVKIDTVRWLLNGKAVFENCSSLTALGSSANFEENKIKLETYKLENLWNGAAAPLFKGCSSITSVHLTGCKTFYDDGKTSQAFIIAENTFAGCTSLTDINFGDASIIKANAFDGCTALTTLKIPTTITSIAANAFNGCSALTKVTLMTEEYTDGLMTATSFPDMETLTVYCQNDEVTASVKALGYEKTNIVSLRYAEGEEAKYSWSLDRETGILTFTRKVNTYAELSFNATNYQFVEWVQEYGDEIKHIVIPSFNKFSIEGDSPFASLKNLETVKIDTVRWLTRGKNIFGGCTSLTTLGNSSNFEVGKVKMDGIKLENISTMHGNIFKGCTSITSIDFTGMKVYSDDGNTQITTAIGSDFMSGCTALISVNLTGIEKIAVTAFASCTALKNITVPTSVASIASGAFSGCSALRSVTLESESFTDGLMNETSLPDMDGLIIYCQNGEVASAVNALGYTLTKAVNVNIKAESGIKMEGFSIRTKEYNGLRGIFSFDKSSITENETNGLALVEYGTILTTEANKNTYGTALTFDGTGFVTANSKVIKKEIFKNGAFVGNILTNTSTETTFAVTVVKYTDNYTTNVCMLGYSIWQDGAGNNYIKYVDCENDEFDSTNIYKVTLGMYKDGAVNAEDDPDGVIWGVLETQAVTLSAGDDYRDGDRDLGGVAFGSEVRFANMPLYQSSNLGSVGVKDSSGNTINAMAYTAKKNTTFTLLPDGDDYVAVFRGDGALPTCNYYGAESYSALHHSFNAYNGSGGTKYAPSLYNENGERIGYIDASGNYKTLNTDAIITDSGVHRRQPTPTLTTSTIAKIKTVVIDEGITGIPNYFFCNTALAHIQTVIYASSVNSIGTASFMSHKTLVTMSPKGVSPTENLMDLTGFTSFGSSCFNKAAQVEHMLLIPKGVALPNRFFYGEDTARSPKTLAISTDRSTLKEGFADLRGITSISTEAFTSTLLSKVYFDDGITSIANNAFKTTLALTFYTNAANNAALESFVADNSYRTYIGGTSFDTAFAASSSDYIEN